MEKGPGRPAFRFRAEVAKQVQFRIKARYFRRIQQLAYKDRSTRSKVMRDLVEDYFAIVDKRKRRAARAEKTEKAA